MRESWPPPTASRTEYILVALAIVVVIVAGIWSLNDPLSPAGYRHASCATSKAC
jgi:hypothetical protein